MARGFILYDSYIFRKKDPIIDKVRTVVEDSGMTWSEIAEMSCVSRGTMSNWFMGSTKRPQFCTINAVARACGKELVFASMRKRR